ncbi:6-carboxytetrahydropterin synthase QueD [Hyphococcus sp.]|jgi:6-pyruvoyltetrahydropterin/6-carboxytetrahydropterin synthase|uniref:6-carboxytetrahydropterin synthase QueD n=1 Tax=Hyphococcus sp. TaxID=2038636 RepID=UPI003D0F4B66
MRIVKSMSFDAAHYLDHDPDARPYARLHGHSFTLEVVIEGEPQAETGWVVDFGDVGEALQELHDALDHRLLNEVEGLERPTLENICKWAAAKLKPRFPGLAEVRVSRPSIGETCIHVL